MPAISSIIAAVGIAASAAGTIVGMQGQEKAAQAAIDVQKSRNQQMNLESARQNREIARRSTMARATALSSATNQGAGQGTGIQGGFAQISGEAGRATVAVNQNQDIGQSIFNAHMREYQGGSQAAFGSGLASLGSTIFNNQQMFSRVGSYLFNQPSAGV